MYRNSSNAMAGLADHIAEAVEDYTKDVRARRFPEKGHTYQPR